MKKPHLTPRLVTVGAAALTLGIALTGCSTAASTDSTNDATIDTAALAAEITEAAETALSAPTEQASTLFSATIAHSEALHELDPEMFSPVTEEFSSGRWSVTPDSVDLNAVNTRAEVSLTSDDAAATDAPGSRMVLVWQGGEWKLHDLVEFYDGEDISLTASIEEMYATYAHQDDHS